MRHLPLFLLAACSGDGTDDSSSSPEPLDTIGWDPITENVIGIPQEGVEVCTDAGCETSNVLGQVHVELVVGEGVMRTTFEGPEVHQFLTIDDAPPEPARILVVNQATWELVEADLPVLDPTLGMVLVSNAFQPGSVNALDVVADGPYYLNPTFSGIDAAATETTESGVTLFVNVPIGDVEVSYTPPAGQPCKQTPWMWPGANPDTSRVEVSAGVVSSTELDCFN